MKKFPIIFLAFTLAVAASCSGFLDTVRTDAVSTGNMWTDESKADAGMAGIYYPLYKTNLTRTQIRMEDYDGLNRTGMEGNGFTSDEYSSNYPLQYLYRSTKQAMDFQGRLEWQIIFINKAASEAYFNDEYRDKITKPNEDIYKKTNECL